MKLIGENVKSETLGIGEIIEQDDNYITVQFIDKVSKFAFPKAFESFLKLENKELQTQIYKLLEEINKREEEKKELKKEQEKNINKISLNKNHKAKEKDIDKMFDSDYHVKYLKRNPILTYRQVEDQFGIKISGFGRGINPTSNGIVLISSMRKSGGKFVYHDKWTISGDYIYSGEGKNGDQKKTKGNLAIINAQNDGKKIFLFVKLSSKEYYYQGIFKLVDYTYEDDIDENGQNRKEYKFRLRREK